MKLLWKMLIPILALIVVLMSAAGFVSYRQAADSLQAAVVENLRGEAEALKRTTTIVLGESMHSVKRLAGDPAVIRFFEGDTLDRARALDLSATLSTILESYPALDRVNIFGLSGDIIASSSPDVIGNNFASREYFTAAAKGNDFVSAPFVSSITKQGMLIVSAPIKRGNTVVGVINSTISLPGYYETAVKPVRIGKTGYAYAIDAKGRLVAHSRSELLFREDIPTIEAYRDMANSPDGSRELINVSGKEAFAYHIKEPFSSMTLVIQAEQAEVFGSLKSLATNAALVVAIATVLGALTLWLLVRPVVNALNKGVAYASDIARGNLDSTLDVKPRKDEIGVLADALRSIPLSLKSIIAEYERLEADLVNGQVCIQGDASKFSGAYADLIQGTNGMLSRYRLILDLLSSPVVVLDRHLRIVYLNEVAKALAGNEYAGKTCGEVMAREDFNTPACALQKAVDTLRPATAETAAHPLGKNLDVSYTAIPFTDKEGKLSAVLQLITDLTAIKSTQRTIMEVADEARDISTRVATASEQLSAQVEQVSKGADIQCERASSTATAMEEMNSTVLEVARNAAEANQQAGSTHEKAVHGADLVNQVIAAIAQVNEVAQVLERDMTVLGNQAESIGNVMNVISDIADQTNLLALNAAIEAARAGEAGRGFAVVADEVRKLAEKTMGATTEVDASIRGIQDSTVANIKRVKDASQSVGKATDLAQVSGAALTEILDLVNLNSGLISGIAAAAEEQSATSEEINRAVDDINRIAEDTAQGMNQSASAVQQLAQMAQELQHLLERLQQ